MTTFAAARMFKRNTKTKRKVCVEPFDETGEIQVVPIDTVVGDGGYDLEVDDASGNRAQDSKHIHRMLRLPLGVDSHLVCTKVLRAGIPPYAADHGGGNQTSWLNVSLNHVGNHRPMYDSI